MNNKVKILLVEDDNSLCQLISMVLELEGYEVTVSNDGEQAISYLKNNTVDLILLDIFMPVLDGTHVLHWLRVEEGLDTKVLILTAMSESKTKDSDIYMRANGVIQKPLDVNKIIESVDELLKH